MWEHAAKLACDAVLDGLSRCRRCSIEGRAAMSLDFGLVERGVRGILPAGAAVGGSLRLVDAYVKVGVWVCGCTVLEGGSNLRSGFEWWLEYGVRRRGV